MAGPSYPFRNMGYRLASRLPEKQARVVVDSLEIMKNQQGMPFGWLGAAERAIHGLVLEPVYSRIFPSNPEQPLSPLERILLPFGKIAPAAAALTAFFVKYGANYLSQAIDKLPFKRF